MTHTVGVVFSAVVGILSIALSVIAYRAYRRTGNRSLLFVAGAFGLFFLKGIAIVASWDAWDTQLFTQHALEITASVFDFLIVAMLVTPLLLRR